MPCSSPRRYATIRLAALHSGPEGLKCIFAAASNTARGGAEQRLAQHADKVRLVSGNFVELLSLAEQEGIKPVYPDLTFPPPFCTHGTNVPGSCHQLCLLAGLEWSCKWGCILLLNNDSYHSKSSQMS